MKHATLFSRVFMRFGVFHHWLLLESGIVGLRVGEVSVSTSSDTQARCAFRGGILLFGWLSVVRS